ncbi:hypothetical protein [Bacillus sp. X1(2014)]|uniref:hypothetical protein n=1 Tax=Bacillus sp. X1(2014) TaxID=1565991 RepID=UPI00119FC29B|nr:hypothetical protein [Bacillus sp. X1(2014)]
MKRKSIHELELGDFDVHPVWKTVEFDADELDELVEPFEIDKEVIDFQEDYWVRIKGVLNDGSEIYGIGQINIEEGNIFSMSFFVKGDWEVLHLPPAPDFVLEETGPIPFASKLSKEINCVFPMKVLPNMAKEVTHKDIVNLIET